MSYVRVVLMTICALAAVAAPLEAATATWNRNPEPTVTGYRLSYGTQPGVHPTTINVGNVVSYQFFPPVGQRYYVVVQAYSSSGALSSKSAEVILDLTGSTPPPANQPPAFTQPANQTSLQNTSASLTLSATDPQGSAVTYSATGLPAGLSLNASTGVISGTVTTVGSFNVTATVSDGALTTMRTFTWTVTASGGGTQTVLLSPVDTSLNAEEPTTSQAGRDRLYAQTHPAYRPYRAILMRFDLSQIPANAVIQTASLQLSLVRADTLGDPTYSISLHQIINRNPDVARATAVTYNGTNAWTAHPCCGSVSLAQADISPARATLAVDKTLGTKAWDARSVVQAWRDVPATNYGLLLNADTTKLAGRYRHFASMEYATVSQRPLLRVTYTLPGAGGDTTAPAVALSAPSNGATVSGTSSAVSATASDAVGVVGVQFKVDGVNIGAEDTTSPYSITWNSTAVSNGSHQLTAVARDAAGHATTSAARTITVSNAAGNGAPVLTQPANRSSVQNTAASLQLVASDPQGTPVSFAASGLPPGLTVNASTGVISGTVTTVGNYTVTATASDGSLNASRSFTWTVTASTGGTTTVNLSPLDTTIEYKTTNFSALTTLSTHTYPANRVRKAIVMKFDVSQIPANATIQSATLQLYLVGVDAYTTDPNYAVSLHRIVNFNSNPSVATGYVAAANRPWTTNTCCSLGAPLAQSDISAVQAVTTINRSLGVKTWNALSLVQAWRSAPATNFGLLLNADKTRAADRFRNFASMEDGTASRRPFLRITYTLPSGPTTSALSAASMSAEDSGDGVAASLASATDVSVNNASLLAQPADGDTPVAGDFDGDGRPDPATFRLATGEWRVLLSASNFVAAAPIVWGVSTDLPVPADYDGDDRTDIAVYRPSTGTWHVLLSSTDMQSTLEVQWGEADDRPLALDHDRDGRADMALPRSGGFDILLSGSNYTKSVTVR